MKSQRRTDTTFGNPVIARRELTQQQQLHRQRISEIKSTLDTRPPAPQPHLTLYGRDYVSKKKATTEAAFSDLKMIQAIARTMTREKKQPERKGPISLNADARKQEIYNIMHANHKLLENIESVGPVMKTKDLIKDHRDKIRYVINSSHTMRLSGEYDSEIERIRKEDRDRFEATQRHTRMKMDASQRLKSSGGSVSLPSLTTTSRSDQGLAGGSRSPEQSRGSGAASASASASSAQLAPAAGKRPAQRTPGKASKAGAAQEQSGERAEATAAVAAKPSVHFSSPAAARSPKHRTRRTSTPHPNKSAQSFELTPEEVEELDATPMGEDEQPDSPQSAAQPRSPVASEPQAQPESPQAAAQPESPQAAAQPESPQAEAAAAVQPDSPQGAAQPDSPQASAQPDSPQASAQPDSQQAAGSEGPDASVDRPLEPPAAALEEEGAEAAAKAPPPDPVEPEGAEEDGRGEGAPEAVSAEVAEAAPAPHEESNEPPAAAEEEAVEEKPFEEGFEEEKAADQEAPEEKAPPPAEQEEEVPAAPAEEAEAPATEAPAAPAEEAEAPADEAPAPAAEAAASIGLPVEAEVAEVGEEQPATQQAEAEEPLPEQQQSRMEDDYEEDYEEEYEDEFAEESPNASRSMKGQDQKDTSELMDESATFEDSNG